MARCTSLILAAMLQVAESDGAEGTSCLQTVRGGESTLQEVRQSGSASQSSMDTALLAFVEEHGRTYRKGSAEFEQRRNLFQQSVEEVEKWNSRPNRLWTAGINHLSDWTDEEKKSSLFGYRGHPGRRGSLLQLSRSGEALAPKAASLFDKVDEEVPESFIVNASNLVNVEDQGNCGSCWAFAAMKMLEINHLVGTGKHRSFSAQELVDCTPNPQECGGQGGCDGATVELAMAWVSKYGLSTAEDTPYYARDRSCKTSLIQGKVDALEDISIDELFQPGIVREAHPDAAKAIQMQSWERLPENKKKPLMVALYQWGSVAVSVDGTYWPYYSHGVFDSCGKDAVIDHAVLCTGYGKDKSSGVGFFKILNSWGPWGEDGYIRLKMVEDDYCGIDRKPEDGTGCKGGPAQVEVCGMCGLYYDNVVTTFKSEM